MVFLKLRLCIIISQKKIINPYPTVYQRDLNFFKTHSVVSTRGRTQQFPIKKKSSMTVQ